MQCDSNANFLSGDGVDCKSRSFLNIPRRNEWRDVRHAIVYKSDRQTHIISQPRRRRLDLSVMFSLTSTEEGQQQISSDARVLVDAAVVCVFVYMGDMVCSSLGLKAERNKWHASAASSC